MHTHAHTHLDTCAATQKNCYCRSGLAIGSTSQECERLAKKSNWASAFVQGGQQQGQAAWWREEEGAGDKHVIEPLLVYDRQSLLDLPHYVRDLGAFKHSEQKTVPPLPRIHLLGGSVTVPRRRLAGEAESLAGTIFVHFPDRTWVNSSLCHASAFLGSHRHLPCTGHRLVWGTPVPLPLPSSAFSARREPLAPEDAATGSPIHQIEAPGSRQVWLGERQITGEQNVYPKGFLNSRGLDCLCVIESWDWCQWVQSSDWTDRTVLILTPRGHQVVEEATDGFKCRQRAVSSIFSSFEANLYGESIWPGAVCRHLSTTQIQ